MYIHTQTHIEFNSVGDQRCITRDGEKKKIFHAIFRTSHNSLHGVYVLRNVCVVFPFCIYVLNEEQLSNLRLCFVCCLLFVVVIVAPVDNNNNETIWMFVSNVRKICYYFCQFKAHEMRCTVCASGVILQFIGDHHCRIRLMR